MWLTHDLIMYDDVLAILVLMNDGFTWNEYTLIYIAVKLLYSMAISDTHTPDIGIDYFPYPYDTLDDEEEDYITD